MVFFLKIRPIKIACRYILQRDPRLYFESNAYLQDWDESLV